MGSSDGQMQRTRDGHQRPNSAIGEPSGSTISDGSIPRGLAKIRGARRWSGWWLVVYAYILGTFSVGLSQETELWWLVPVLGLAALIAFLALDRPGAREREGELMAALQSTGGLTAVEAALRTSLTVEEARRILEKLAQDDHLLSRIENGATVYELHTRNRAGDSSGETSTARSDPAYRSNRRGLDEPLSGRELEVLEQLSRGKTNAEISAELFVSVGTIKTHVNNIYRKLDVRNRTAAVSRARELNLLDQDQTR